MRYMFLIYTTENPNAEPAMMQEMYRQHHAVMDESIERGVFIGADPLHPAATATTVRTTNGKSVTTDGPFAETKEQLAGYYILDCANLEEAIAWARKIPTQCRGGQGSIEIRAVAERPPRP